jgi:hypothetical protein
VIFGGSVYYSLVDARGGNNGEIKINPSPALIKIAQAFGQSQDQDSSDRVAGDTDGYVRTAWCVAVVGWLEGDPARGRRPLRVRPTSSPGRKPQPASFKPTGAT